MNPWFRSFFVSSNPLSRKPSQESQAVEYRINREINHVVEKEGTYGWNVLFVNNKSRGSNESTGKEVTERGQWKFEDIKGWNQKSIEKRIMSKEQTMIYKTLHRKLKTEKYKPNCSICTTRCVTLDTNPMISHECGKNLFVITTNGTYPWSFVTVIFQHAGTPGMLLHTNGRFTTRKLKASPLS